MGEPTIVYVRSEDDKRVLQKPKSATLMTPSWRRILDGLRSRWRIFSLKSDLKAFTICWKITSASRSVRNLRFFT